MGPEEIDKTSSGVTSGSIGTVDSCLAANTGKYMFPVTTCQIVEVTERSESDYNADQRVSRRYAPGEQGFTWMFNGSPTNP